MSTKQWRYLSSESGTTPDVGAVRDFFPPAGGSGETLLRTIAGCTVSAVSNLDPITNGSAHSQLILALWQSTDGSAPDTSWPYPGQTMDEVLRVSLSPCASTVYPANFVTASAAQTTLHFGHTPEGADSKAQRKLTSDFASLYFAVSGSNDSPGSGLTFFYRLWVKQLWETP